ncbi:MAG TPA: phytanoyl-CoA dioxygenase family protein [Pyrinomonadaceae bacterium]|jgi:ectoine hydroxylase-related dioxygenase (phytanoyl-CoA dioxygenase family)|nr:phytanoyl-CoA dioxygenase family protein [Pyrinomonadaceae bacterium]
MTGGELFEKVRREGFAVVAGVLGAGEVASLVGALERTAKSDGGRRRGGLRNLLEVVPEALALAESEAVRGLVEPLLGAECFAVRGILFDKTPAAPWKVAWHQDLSIAVRGRREVEGFGPWSLKAGVVHVQPPAEVLARVLAVRLHLDDCDEGNGALKVLPGTHLRGRLGAAEMEELKGSVPPVTCEAKAGDALLMRPLLLHASGAPREPRPRRVIHLEFAAGRLPGGLEWRGAG